MNRGNDKYRCVRCGLAAAVDIVYRGPASVNAYRHSDNIRETLVLDASETKWDWEEELINRHCKACLHEWHADRT